MIFISFVNKYTKIDRRKIFLAKIVEVTSIFIAMEAQALIQIFSLLRINDIG